MMVSSGEIQVVDGMKLGKITIKGPGAVTGKKNREAIKEWFRTHLCGTQAECAADLGLSPMAVNRHVKAIRREWKKEGV